MGTIYTGIDLGSHSMKVIVANKVEDSFHVLAAASSKSSGIQKGYVTETKQAVESLKKAVSKTEEMLGAKIKKAVVCVPAENVEITIVEGNLDFKVSKEIDGEDITNVLKDALLGKIDHEKELITAIPIYFKVGEEVVKDPKGLIGENLEVKAVITTVFKEPLYRILEVVRLAGIEALDICFHTTGDYYELKNPKMDNEVGAVVNIGEDTTDVSIFNKGIMIKNSILPIGSKFVDKDISYVYKTDLALSKKMKEEFSVAVTRYADSNDLYEIKEQEDKIKEIKQTELSNVVESRIMEILKLVKKELKILTNREIRYIIITGGLSELAGFQYAVEEVLGHDAKIGNIPSMGVRHNKYSSVLGLLKYYDDKMKLRGKNLSMFTASDEEVLHSDSRKDLDNNRIVSQVFGHFFDN